MRRIKTADEGRVEKATRGRLCQLAAAVSLLVAVLAPSPVRHGQRLAGLALSIHEWIPEGLPNLAAVSLVLATCYWLFGSPAFCTG